MLFSRKKSLPYVSGRLARCFAEMDLIINRDGCAGSIGGSARLSASVISACTGFESNNAVSFSTM
jgi:hypothetical protein